MFKLNFRILVFGALLIVSFNLHAVIPPEFSKFFKDEQYQEAINILKDIDEQIVSLSQKYYLTGLCHSRLREYDLAIQFFSKANKADDSIADLHYEYGQALYAINNLKQARYEFSISAGRNNNYTASVYYIAYISELLNDDVTAKASYLKLIKDKRTDKKFLQISFFQYSKVLLRMMRKEEETFKTIKRTLITLDINLVNYIPKYILPLLKKALDFDPNSQVAIEIGQLINDLTNEFKLDPNVMLNGRRLSAKRLYINISQGLRYDNNVALTKNASTLYATELFAKYDFAFRKRIISSPEFRISNTKYKDQKNPDVYKNDSLSITSAIRNKLEHTYHGLPASFLLDAEYSSLNKDWQFIHHNKYFSKTYSFGLGEQLSLSSSGETYFKMRYSNYADVTGLSNYKMTSASADQYIFLKEGQHLLIATLDFSKFNYFDYTSNSYNAYLVRFIYMVFEVMPSYTLQFLFSATVTDPLTQVKARGYEVTLNPTIDISKAITDKLRLSLNYSYTNNSSKQSEYQYKKGVVASELSYTF